MDCTLIEWLNASYLPEDVTPLPWDLKVEYMPIPVVRQKIEVMETKFNVDINQTEVIINAINTTGKDADTCFFATVKFVLKHAEFKGGVKRICGTASLLAGQYNGSWSFAQIAESLATTRAFSKHWKQFGKGLNEKDDPIKNMTPPKISGIPDKMDRALKSFKRMQ